MIRTPFTRLLGIRHPIVQSGMGADLQPPVDVNFAGESAGLVREILPAAEIVARTVSEAEDLLRHAASLVVDEAGS